MFIQPLIVIICVSVISIVLLLVRHARKHTGWPLVWPIAGVLVWYCGLSLPYHLPLTLTRYDFPYWAAFLLFGGTFGLGCSCLLIFALYPFPTWRKGLWAILAVITGLASMIVLTWNFTSGVPRFNPLSPLKEQLYGIPVILLWLLICVALVLSYLGYWAFRSHGQQRVQIRYTLAGVLIICLGVAIQFVLFVPHTQIPSTVLPLVSFCCGILLLTYTHTARYPLLDGRLLLRPLLAFTVTLLIVAGFYSLCGGAVFSFLLKTPSIPFASRRFLFNILQVTTFLLLYPLIAAIVQRYLLRFPYDARRALSRTSAALLSVYDTDEVVGRWSASIAETIRPAACALYLLDDSEVLARRGQPGVGDPLPSALPVSSPIWRQLTGERTVLLGEELRRYRDDRAIAGNAMLEAGAAVAVPLIADKLMRGCFLCTEKQSGDGYTQQDLQVLMAMCQQTSLALDNVAHYEELSRLNAELEARVEERTRELAEANSQLLQANQAKDFFLALVSHELLNPLTGIMGWADVGLRTEDPKLHGQVIATIHQNGLRLKRLVYDLLDTARMIHGKLTIEPEPQDLWYLVKSAMDDMTHELQTKQLTVVCQPPDEPLPVLADTGRIQQVVANLLGNAMKFTPAGGTITLTGWREGDLCKFSVTDTGKGIPADKLTRIFERFQQVPGDHKAGGLGLGLALVRGIMDLHNGTVTAVSAGPGQGSTFTIALPVHIPELTPDADCAEPVTVANSGPNME